MSTRRDFLKMSGAALAAGAIAVRSAGDAEAADQEAYSGQFAAPPEPAVFGVRIKNPGLWTIPTISDDQRY